MATVSHYTDWTKPVNFDLLHQEMRAALGDVFVGLFGDGQRIGAYFESDVEPVTDELLQTAMAVLEAHDWTQTTDQQQEAEDDAEAWRQFTALASERIAWHEANPVTAQNAIEAAARMQAELVYIMRLLRSGSIRIQF